MSKYDSISQELKGKYDSFKSDKLVTSRTVSSNENLRKNQEDVDVIKRSQTLKYKRVSFNKDVEVFEIESFKKFNRENTTNVEINDINKPVKKRLIECCCIIY
jgi:hypothetical protein